MPDPTPHSAAFQRNAQAALHDGTFEDVLGALVMTLRDRGVFDEERAEEARKVNEPLARAYLRPRDQAARDRAWDGISARIFELGGLLPPEDADGAFLADRARVEELVEKRKTLYAQKAVEEMRQRREADQRRADEHDDEDEATDFGAEPSEGDLFESLGKKPDFFRRMYSGAGYSSGRGESSQNPNEEVSQNVTHQPGDPEPDVPNASPHDSASA